MPFAPKWNDPLEHESKDPAKRDTEENSWKPVAVSSYLRLTFLKRDWNQPLMVESRDAPNANYEPQPSSNNWMLKKNRYAPTSIYTLWIIPFVVQLVLFVL